MDAAEGKGRMSAATARQDGFDMSEHINKIEDASGEADLPADVEMMLRAHAETRCLSREVIPVLRQIETGDGLPQEQYGAAMAYLEVTWLAARRCAQESDAAYGQLCALLRDGTLTRERSDELHGGACRYYEAVKALREVAGRRVSRLLGAAEHMTGRLCESAPGAGC